MPSHITYAPGQVTAFENQSSLQQPYLSSAGCFQQNVSNLSETMPVYLWDSKLGAEDPQASPKIGNVLESKTLSSVDAGPSNSEDLKPIKSDIKHEIRASLKPLESRTHLLTPSSDFSVRSVKPLKVNASGQFVGLAEMIGPVDFKKSMDFWQQDKWNGFFQVKWHIIKDIPNKNFQHITLENNDNNDNKAVTFSRDTQDIKLPQGLSMLQIFKAYQSATSMLDDFDCYEEKEKEKSLCASRSNHPGLTHSKVGLVDDSSLKHLELSFGNMSMSARPRKSYAASQYPSSNLTRRPSVNSCLPVNRS